MKSKPLAHLCIAAVSFPRSIEELANMLAFDEDHREWRTHLQLLLELAISGETGTWSVPRWFKQGDVLLFYQSKKVRARAVRLLLSIYERAEAQLTAETLDATDPIVGAVHALEEELIHFHDFGGTIFGAARVNSDPWMEPNKEDPEQSSHWKSRVFAEIADVGFSVSRFPLRICEA